MTINDTWATATDLGSSYGTTDYDGLTTTWELHYKFTPPAGVKIVIGSNEPWYYCELYDEITHAYLDYGYPTHLLSFIPTGMTYHLVVYPNKNPTPTTVYNLTWGLPDFSHGHWSEWFQNPVQRLWSHGYGAFKQEIVPFTVTSTVSAQDAYDRAKALFLYSTNAVSFKYAAWNALIASDEVREVSSFFSVPVPQWTTQLYGLRSLSQVQAAASWATDFDMSPPQLIGLVQDKDYTYVPGTNDFVQYEIGVTNTFIGWTMTDNGVITYGVDFRYWGGPGSYELYENGFDFVTTGPADYMGYSPATLAGGWPTNSGSFIASPDGLHAGGSVLDGFQYITINPITPKFALRAVINPLFPLLMDGDHWPVTQIGLASAIPYPVVQMPRFRYWIPGGTPPLRQRHRDDGLATDTRQEKGRGSSLQSSLRQSSRTYY